MRSRTISDNEMATRMAKRYGVNRNEILAKCLAHNVYVLIQEMFVLVINVDFKNNRRKRFG